MYPSDLLDHFNIRLPDGTRERVRVLAKKNLRSMNNEIVLAIMDWLERHEAKASESAAGRTASTTSPAAY